MGGPRPPSALDKFKQDVRNPNFILICLGTLFLAALIFCM